MSMLRIAVLGASGLIGHAMAHDLARRGFAVRGYARRFTPAQAHALAGEIVEAPLVALCEAELAALLADADMVVNCVGMLQGRTTDLVHRVFAGRLAAVCAGAPAKLLLHMSMPGAPGDDNTPFSRSKREAEKLIAASGAPFVILRPGFVIAPNAYGGSALMRALAALPVRLPPRDAGAPFATVAIRDICETVASVAARWQGGERDWRKNWDVMEERPGQLADVLEAFRGHVGGPAPLLTVPSGLVALGAWAGDVAAWLGWRPPLRSTAIREIRRGVAGNPALWIAETGIHPLSAKQALADMPLTVQEQWFARLYVLKAVALTSLVLFWCASGLIALTIAFQPARAILLHHGFPFVLAHSITVASSVMDILIGCAIALQRTCRLGLIAGIAVSLFYMAGAAIFTPQMWIEPLGALVKTFPAIILMLVCLAIRDDR